MEVAHCFYLRISNRCNVLGPVRPSVSALTAEPFKNSTIDHKSTCKIKYIGGASTLRRFHFFRSGHGRLMDEDYNGDSFSPINPVWFDIKYDTAQD